MKRLIVGITGASGSIYAKTLIDNIIGKDFEIHLVVTENGKKVFQYEMDLGLYDYVDGLNCQRIFVHDNADMFSCIASGSFKTEGMVILPASMATVSKIANGIADTLLCRAADVVLKERRTLVVCPRESPLNSIHLKNMLTLSESNAIILPPLPGFYAKPKSVGDIVEFSVRRVMGFFGEDFDDSYEWGVTR